MKEAEKIDFNFRYRPLADTSDGILVSYLKNQTPLQKKHIILKALRAFYLIPAYANASDLNSPAKFVEFAKRVRKTYEQNLDRSLRVFL